MFVNNTLVINFRTLLKNPMTQEQFNQCKEDLASLRRSEQDNKQAAYTHHSEDVLANFKIISRVTGMTPLQVLNVYKAKHDIAFSTYVNMGLEAEPVETRIADLMNYCELAYALIREIKASQAD